MLELRLRLLRVFKALAEFGAPLMGIHAEDFAAPDLIYQLGVAPSRIDVPTSISGVSFEDAGKRKKEADCGDVRVLFISLEDLPEQQTNNGSARGFGGLRTAGIRENLL